MDLYVDNETSYKTLVVSNNTPSLLEHEPDSFQLNESLILKQDYHSERAYNNGGVENLETNISFEYIGFGIRNTAFTAKVMHYCFGLMLIVIGVAGALGNGLVLYVFTRYRRLRGGGGPLILSLAAGDFSVSLLHIMPAYSSFKETWSFGTLGCELYAAAVGLCGMASLLTLAVIAAERFSVIMGAPVRWLSSKKVCVLIWVLSLGLVIPPFLGWSKYVIEGVGTSCSWDYTSRDFRNRVYYIFLLTFGFFVPVSIIIISYLGILQVVCKQSSRMNGFSRNGGLRKKSPTRSDLKTAQVILSIIVCFMVSWTPYAIISMIGQFGDASLLSPLSTALPAIFAKSSVIYNPFVYGLSHPLFRTAFATLKDKYLGKWNGGGINANPRHNHHCSFCRNKYPSGTNRPRKTKLVVTARGDGTFSNAPYDHRHQFHLDGQKMQGEGFRGKMRHFTGNADTGERTARSTNEDESADHHHSNQCPRLRNCPMKNGMTLSTMQTSPSNSVRRNKNLHHLKKGVWIFKTAKGECQVSGSDATARTALNTCNESSVGDGIELETSLSIPKNPYSVYSNGDSRRPMKNSYTFFMCEYRKRRQDNIQTIFFRSENCLNDIFMEKAASNPSKSHLSTALEEQGARQLTRTMKQERNNEEEDSIYEQYDNYFQPEENVARYHSIDNSDINKCGAGALPLHKLDPHEEWTPKHLSKETRHSICCTPILVNSNITRREFSLVNLNTNNNKGKTVSKELNNQNGTFPFCENYNKVKPDFSSCQYQKGKEGERNANTKMIRTSLPHTKKTYSSAGDMEKAARNMTSMSNGGMNQVGKKGELLRKSVSLSGLKVTAVESIFPSQTTFFMAYPTISEFALNDPNEQKESTRTRMSEITSCGGFEIDSGSCSWGQCRNNCETPFSSADEESRDEDIDPLRCSGSLYASCNSDLCSQDFVEDKLWQ